MSRPVNEAHRCKAHTTAGRPCKNAAISGATVCRVHGGSAPQVLRKAAERLKEARDLALERLTERLGVGTTTQVDSKILLEACVKLTELTETLEGRVSSREEVRHDYADRTDSDLICEAESILQEAVDR